MLKRLIKWIIQLWGLLVNKPLKEILNIPENVEGKPNVTSKKRAERLKRFKEDLTKKNYPIITEKTYSRKLTRYQVRKTNKQEQHALALEGKHYNDNGDIVATQKPYRKSEYKSLAEYNRYAKLFNYNNR